MTADRKPALARRAEWFMGKLLRVWPAETRQWGVAMVAELEEIEDPWAVLRWSLGGVALFLRSLVSHLVAWMRLPAGVGLNKGSASIGEVPPPSPKHSRFLTAVLFFAAALVLVLPQGREAITAVRASWSPSDMADSDKRAIEALAARAMHEKDARQLAFAAISYPERERSEKWAEQAVAMDASLRWIYANHAIWGMLWEIPETHLQALREFDPENSFVYLLSADRIYRNKIFPLYDHGSPSQQQISQLLADDPQWALWMEKALRAARYDNYEQKRYELQRQVWSENRWLSPDIIAQSIQSHAWPEPANLMALATLSIQQAKQAHLAGDNAAAEECLRKLPTFADRLSANGQTDLLVVALRTVERKCLAELEALYTSTGRTGDAAAVAARIAQLEKLQNRHSARPLQTFETLIVPFRWKAYGVQLSALALLLFAITSALSLIVLELAGIFSYRKSGPVQKLLCFAADYAPVVLLLASVSFFLSYRPFAHAFAEFRSGQMPFANQTGLLFLLYSLRFASPTQFGAGDTYRLWWAITLLLSGLAVFILIRPLLKHRTAS